LVQKDLRPELGKLPVVTIKNGVASSPVEQPWVRSVDENGVRSIFVLDTTGKVTGFEANEQGVVLTRTALVVKSMNNPQVQSLQLADLFDEDTTIDAKWVETYANKAVWWVAGAALIARPFYQTAAKLLAALLTSLLALVISASARKRPLRYGQIFTIAIYALTPAILLDTVFDVINIEVPHFWVLYMLIASGYAALGVYKTPDEAAPAAQWPQPPSA
jgi:hypothetical protein